MKTPIFSVLSRATIGVLLFGTVQSVSATTLDFEGLSDGDAVTNQFAAQGVTISNGIVLGAGISLNEIESPPKSGSNVVSDEGSTATIDAPASVKPSFIIDRAGTYLLQLIVNNGKTESATDTVEINTTNSKPVANAGLDQTVAVGLPASWMAVPPVIPIKTRCATVGHLSPSLKERRQSCKAGAPRNPTSWWKKPEPISRNWL